MVNAQGKKNIRGTGRVELGGKSEKLVQTITAGLNSERKQEYEAEDNR